MPEVNRLADMRVPMCMAIDPRRMVQHGHCPTSAQKEQVGRSARCDRFYLVTGVDQHGCCDDTQRTDVRSSAHGGMFGNPIAGSSIGSPAIFSNALRSMILT
jgi:hypothetical protein